MSVWDEIQEARAKAHAKHGGNSIEAISANDPRWLTILVEEVGEVAHELTYDATSAVFSNPAGVAAEQAIRVRRELVDVLAVASAWLDAADRVAAGFPHRTCDCPPDQHAYAGCKDEVLSSGWADRQIEPGATS